MTNHPQKPARRLPTVKYLESKQNVLWTTIPNDDLSRDLQLLWYCTHELACFLQLTYLGPKHILGSSPETVFLLREAVKSLNAAAQLEPGSLAVLLLKIARYEAGEADGLSFYQD